MTLIRKLFTGGITLKKNLFTIKYIHIVIGILSIIVGLTYAKGLYGPTESEVAFWGYMSIIMGIVTALIRNRIIILSLMICILNIAMQILPISLWFSFHGRGISDGTPPSDFIAHWGFSLPHILILALSSIVVLYFIYSKISNIYKPAK